MLFSVLWTWVLYIIVPCVIFMWKLRSIFLINALNCSRFGLKLLNLLVCAYMVLTPLVQAFGLTFLMLILPSLRPLLSLQLAGIFGKLGVIIYSRTNLQIILLVLELWWDMLEITRSLLLLKKAFNSFMQTSLKLVTYMFMLRAIGGVIQVKQVLDSSWLILMPWLNV